MSVNLRQCSPLNSIFNKGNWFRSFVSKASIVAKSKFPMRIRKAVGDQASNFNATMEKDSDWIKIDAVIRRMNPAIIDGANRAINREPWTGEGTVQDAYDSSVVSHISDIDVLATSPAALRAARSVLEALCPLPHPEAESVRFGATVVSFRTMVPWAGATVERLSGAPAARVAGLGFATADPDAAAGASSAGRGCRDRRRVRRFEPGNGLGWRAVQLYECMI